MADKPDLTPERLDELEQDWRHAYAPRWEETGALIAMARAKQAAERERDEWKNKFEMVRHSESDALAENDALTFIARTNGFQRDKAERERDTLLDAIVHADLDSVAEVLRDVIIGDSCEGNCECVIHGLDRLRAVFEAALAQPTTEGGES